MLGSSNRRQRVRAATYDGQNRRARHRDPEVEQAFKTLRKRLAHLEQCVRDKTQGKPATDWQKFMVLYVKATPVALFGLGILYVLWDEVGYPVPGPGFWAHEQVNNGLIVVVSGMLAVAMLRPLLSIVLAMLMVSLLCAWLFR